jgi:glycosidase
MVPTDFWESARPELERVKQDILMLAEWHEPELLVKAFDVDYSWPLHHAMTDVLMGSAPATKVREAWAEEHAKWPRGSLHLRFSDNHDERRAIARFGERAALAASTLIFTMDGVPLIYNGMEVGDTTESGAPALFEKLPIFWQIAERRPEFPRFYRQIIEFRRATPALRGGSLEWLRNSDEARVLTYMRRAGDEEIMIAINFSNRPYTGMVEAPRGAAFADVTPDVAPPLPPDAPAPAYTPPARTVNLPALSLDSWGYRIFRRATK